MTPTHTQTHTHTHTHSIIIEIPREHQDLYQDRSASASWIMNLLLILKKFQLLVTPYFPNTCLSFYRNYKWNMTFKNCELLYVILYVITICNYYMLYACNSYNIVHQLYIKNFFKNYLSNYICHIVTKKATNFRA